MTTFVNFRGNGYGAVCSPYVLSGDALGLAPAMQSVIWNSVPIMARGKDVFLVAHGFNVSYLNGVLSLAQLEANLGIQDSELFLGVLWPGDWIVPAINYPFEDGIASKCGALLAQFCDDWLAQARSLTMVSHSLGARVILSAIKASSQRIRCACITAGAVNDRCLTEEYAAAAANCDRIVTLSSMEDKVLEFAYPPGDFAADVIDPDHPPFEAALGRGGPAGRRPSQVLPREIPNAANYDHPDYLPPPEAGILPTADDPKWLASARFIAQVIRGASPNWS